MSLLAWADHRTLLACHCLLVLVFGAVFLGLRRIYPDLVGVRSLAAGFFFGVWATAAVSIPGAMVSLPAILAANASAFLCYFFIYGGILRFCRSQYPTPQDDRLEAGQSTLGRLSWRLGRAWLNRRNGLRPVLWASFFISTAFLIYSAQVGEQPGPRLAAIALFLVVARTLVAVTLLHYASGRSHMVLFACSLFGFALLTLFFTIVTLWGGPRHALLDQHSVQSIALLGGFLFICVNGIFYIAMIGHAIARKIEEQAHLDFLTGTMNRGGIEKALSVEIARTRRTRRPFSLLMIDLDRFKQINDVFGHAGGDDALRTSARAIASVLRVYDKLGRYGGDEFLVLLPETSGGDAVVTAGRIRETLRLYERTSSTPGITFSIGVTQCTWNEEAIEILARADAALYEAKRAGRDCVRLELPHIPATAEAAR